MSLGRNPYFAAPDLSGPRAKREALTTCIALERACCRGEHRHRLDADEAYRRHRMAGEGVCPCAFALMQGRGQYVCPNVVARLMEGQGQ